MRAISVRQPGQDSHRCGPVSGVQVTWNDKRGPLRGTGSDCDSTRGRSRVGERETGPVSPRVFSRKHDLAEEPRSGELHEGSAAHRSHFLG